LILGLALAVAAQPACSSGDDDDDDNNDDATAGTSGSAGSGGSPAGGGGTGGGGADTLAAVLDEAVDCDVSGNSTVREMVEPDGVIFESCANNIACHGEGASSATDYATLEGLAKRLIESDPVGACSGEGSIIDIDSPDDSLLITKLAESPDCGSGMPLSAPGPGNLPADEVACIESFVKVISDFANDQ